jgi:ankyrin repeat protein
MRKKVHSEEAARFESDKKRAGRMQDEMRMLMIDHQMTGMKREPAKLIRLRAKLDSLDVQQESQKQLLQHLTELEKMTEDLATAAQNGDIVACSALMRRGASVNEMDSAGYLPLHYACANGFTQVVKLLLEFGADPTSYLTGHSPTETAARNGHGEIIKVLSAFGANLEEKGLAGSPPIVSAAAGGFLQTVDELLAFGADINAYDMNENTALHVATRLQDPVSMIRLLLKRGANVMANNKQGHTPLKMALNLVNQAAIEVLGGRSDLDEEEHPIGSVPEEDIFDKKSISSSITMRSGWG